MSNFIQFKQIKGAELQKLAGSLNTFDAKVPLKAESGLDLKAKIRTWQSAQKAPAENIVLGNISAVPLKSANIAKLRSIAESSTPTGEAVVKQKMQPKDIVNNLFSALTVLEYTKLQSEYKLKLNAATTPSQKNQVNQEWSKVVKAAQQMLGNGGLKNLKEADLNTYSKELTKQKANFNSIVKIANSASPVTGSTDIALTAGMSLQGGFVPQTGVLIDNAITTISVGDLCSRPFTEGTFTKHFSKSFSLKVRIPYWCPTWTNPFRVCHKEIVVAGASFSLNLNVGYRVSCCGAVAWGQAAAQACVTVLGIRFCAGCTATVTGVTGFGRTGSGNSCTYGMGVNAALKCTFGGVTVLNLQAPFGFNVSGPCPPAGHIC